MSRPAGERRVVRIVALLLLVLAACSQPAQPQAPQAPPPDGVWVDASGTIALNYGLYAWHPHTLERAGGAGVQHRVLGRARSIGALRTRRR